MKPKGISTICNHVKKYMSSDWPKRTFLCPIMGDKICNFYRAMHFSAKRGIGIACRLSVRLSVCLSVCDVGEL